MNPKLLPVVAGFGALVLSLSSCEHARPSVRPPPLKAAGDSLPYGILMMPPYTLPDFRASDIDIAWLESDDFLPPGAHRIDSLHPKTVATYITPKASFPSTEVCWAPSGARKVACTSAERAGGGGPYMLHTLGLETEGVAGEKTLFKTRHAFDVLWSTDGRRLAVTHYGGRNSSEVVIYGAAPPWGTPSFDARPELKLYFTEYELFSPVFRKAFRWSDGPLLVVRAIGQSYMAPYEVFGYEILVDADRSQDAGAVVFLRGFRRPRQNSVSGTVKPP